MAPPSLYAEPPRHGLMAAGPLGAQRPEVSLSAFLWSVAALLATVELASRLALT